MSRHPEWATRHRVAGTELHLRGTRYYLYSVSSKWDAEKKRTQKLSGRILGRIDENGFYPSGSRKNKVKHIEPQALDYSTISVKEYGLSSFLMNEMGFLTEKLKNSYADQWPFLLCLAYCRVIAQSPINQMPMHFAHSYLSVLFPGLSFTEKNIGLFLRDIGRDRGKATEFMRSFIGRDQHLLFDLTQINSMSTKMGLSQPGYNTSGNFDGQFNVLYVFSLQLQIPVFYRLLPGNIREVSAFLLTVEESCVKDCLLIADKGFYSMANVQALQNAKLSFIIPIKRDNAYIWRDMLEDSSIKYKDNYFVFEQRVIWFTSCEVEQGLFLYLFVDAKLRAEEEKDYIGRTVTHPKTYTIEHFHERRHCFGLIALMTNKEYQEASYVYHCYKNRNQVEVMFDGLKNVLDADRTYMQNEEALQGWMFINHLALIVYYKLYQRLQQKNMLAKYSVAMLVKNLELVKKAKVNGVWVNSEITKKSANFLKKLGMHPDGESQNSQKTESAKKPKQQKPVTHKP